MCSTQRLQAINSRDHTKSHVSSMSACYIFLQTINAVPGGTATLIVPFILRIMIHIFLSSHSPCADNFQKKIFAVKTIIHPPTSTVPLPPDHPRLLLRHFLHRLQYERIDHRSLRHRLPYVSLLLLRHQDVLILMCR